MVCLYCQCSPLEEQSWGRYDGSANMQSAYELTNADEPGEVSPIWCYSMIRYRFLLFPFLLPCFVPGPYGTVRTGANMFLDNDSG